MTDAAPSPKTYIRKAERALVGASVLLKTGDADGACNRAYYAMFDAAHAALFHFAPRISLRRSRRITVLSRSSASMSSLTGHLADAHGEALNKVQRFRQLADYSGDSVSLFRC